MNYKIFYSDFILNSNDKIFNVRTLKKLGASNVEISLNGMENLNFLSSNLPRNITYSVHPPIKEINLGSIDINLRTKSIKKHMETIKFAKDINASYVVIHPGYCENISFKETSKEFAKESILALNEYAKTLDIKLAVENVGDKVTSLFSQKEFINLLNNVDNNSYYLIDVGHAYINGWNIENVITSLEKRLLAMHLNDNNGILDEHLAIENGNVPWEAVYASIRKLKENIILVLEYSPNVAHGELINSVTKLKAQL